MNNEIAAIGQSLQIRTDLQSLSATSVQSGGGSTAVFDLQAFSLELSIDSQVSLFSGQFTDQSKAADFIKALVLLLLWQMQNNQLQSLLSDCCQFLQLVAGTLKDNGQPAAAQQAFQASGLVDPRLGEFLAAGQWPDSMPVDFLTDGSSAPLTADVAAPAGTDAGTGGIDVTA